MASFKGGTSKNLLRSRLQHLTDQLPSLVEQLPNENLDDIWRVLQPLYYDLFMLKAIQESKRSHSPGDTLTRDEALRLLYFLS